MGLKHVEVGRIDLSADHRNNDLMKLLVAMVHVRVWGAWAWLEEICVRLSGVQPRNGFRRILLQECVTREEQMQNWKEGKGRIHLELGWRGGEGSGVTVGTDDGTRSRESYYISFLGMR